MCDFRSSLEKSIDECTESIKTNWDLSNYQIEDLKSGRRTHLNSRYGIDIDDCEKIYVFRSEYDCDRRSCAEEEQCTHDFYEYIKESDIDYQDVEAYQGFAKEWRAKNAKCILCEKNDGVCPVISYNDKLAQIENKRLGISYSNMEKFTKDLMQYLRGAIEDTDETLLSYSKCLTIALFKWSNPDSSLIINKLYTNTVEIVFEASCFDYWKSYDTNRDEKSQYHMEYFSDIIPLRELLYKEMMLSKVYNNIKCQVGEKYDFMDVDNIEFNINGVTIDVSNINRNSLNKYYYYDSIYRYASYKADEEILTTDQKPLYTIKDKKVLQLIRFVFLLRIGSACNDKVIRLVIDIFAGKHQDIIEIADNEREAFAWVWKYLCIPSNIEIEKKKYFKIYKFESAFYFCCWDPEGVIRLLKSFCEQPDKEFFEVDFLKWLLKNSFD